MTSLNVGQVCERVRARVNTCVCVPEIMYGNKNLYLCMGISLHETSHAICGGGDGDGSGGGGGGGVCVCVCVC